MADGKYYWLKLKRDFFKRHDIRVLETRKGGERLVVIYLKLLCESLDHNGELRFSEEVPYEVNTLSAVLNVEERKLQHALDIFQAYGLIEVLEDKTIRLPKIDQMIGSASSSEGAIRQKRYRERLKNSDCVTECYEGVTDDVTKRNESIEIRDKSIEKRDKNIFIAPSVQEVKAYCLERGNNVNPEQFVDFYESKGWLVGKNKMKDWRAAVRTWERNRKDNTKGRLDWIDEVEL